MLNVQNLKKKKIVYLKYTELYTLFETLCRSMYKILYIIWKINYFWKYKIMYILCKFAFIECIKLCSLFEKNCTFNVHNWKFVYIVHKESSAFVEKFCTMNT